MWISWRPQQFPAEHLCEENPKYLKILSTWKFWLLGPNLKKFGDGRNSLSQISWGFLNDHSQCMWFSSVSFHPSYSAGWSECWECSIPVILSVGPYGQAHAILFVSVLEKQWETSGNQHQLSPFLSLEGNVQPSLLSIALTLCSHLNSELKILEGRRVSLKLDLPHHLSSSLHLGGI